MVESVSGLNDESFPTVCSIFLLYNSVERGVFVKVKISKVYMIFGTGHG